MAFLDDIAEHFDQASPSGDGYRAMCPCHSDVKPSLHLSAGRDKGVILHCHAGCQTEDILKAVNLNYRDLFPAGRNGHHKRKLVTPEPSLADTIDQAIVTTVYEDFLGHLDLSDDHHADLFNRGLAPEVIVAGRYRSLGPLAAIKATSKLFEVFGDRLFDVPGFLRNGEWMGTVEVFGLLIPVRNRNGRVIGLKIRQDDPKAQAKYVWFSGGKRGRSIGTPAHVPLGTPAEADVVRITEGPLKADITYAHDPERIPTIGVAGVNSWREAAPLVSKMGAKEVRLAFDADWKRKAPVQAALHQAVTGLQNLGVEVKVEVWEEAQGKGIDDLFVAGGRPDIEEVESNGVQIVFPETDGYLAKELTKVVSRRASDIEPQQITWLWPGWIPYGAITLLDGNPGEGKSTLAADLIARVSTGRALPGQPEAARGPSKVLVVSAEDSPAKVIVPRLIATEGNRENVILWLGVGDRSIRLPQFPVNIPQLQALLHYHRPALTVIDPFLSYLDTGTDSHKAQDVGGVLLILAQLAEQYDTAMLLVRHLNKVGGSSALYRGMGSIGIIGTARAGMLLASHPEDPKRLFLASTKHNWSKAPKSMEVRIDQGAHWGAGVITWVAESDLTADDLVTKPEGKAKGEAVEEAVAWLKMYLGSGPKPATDVQMDSKNAGHSDRTMDRAKVTLKVVVYRDSKKWMWGLPDDPAVKKAKGSRKKVAR